MAHRRVVEAPLSALFASEHAVLAGVCTVCTEVHEET